MSRTFADVCRELDEHLVHLARSLAPVRAPSSTGHAGGKPGSRPPLRLDVSGLLTEIAETVHALDLRATDVLGFHSRPGRGIPAVRAALVALPALVEAIEARDPGSALPLASYEELDHCRSQARSVLGLDPPLLRFDAPCPECGERRLAGRQDVVFCTNRACGLTCGRDDCPCACLCPTGTAVCDCGRRLHPTRWERDHLALLAARLDEGEVSA